MSPTIKGLLAFALIAAMLVVSGCQEDNGQPAETSTELPPTKAGMTADPEDPPQVRGRRLEVPLPANVGLDFPYHVRRDVIEPTGKGDKRRKVGIEYLSVDRDTALMKLDEAFRENGFRKIDTVMLRDGGKRLKYHRVRFGTVILNAPKTPLRQYRNPNAEGHLSLDFPQKKT